MTKKEIFVCDYCTQVSTETSMGTELPYTQGWRYMEVFEFKISSAYRHQTIRKHFCSTACMIKYIECFIHEQEEKINSEAIK